LYQIDYLHLICSTCELHMIDTAIPQWFQLFINDKRLLTHQLEFHFCKGCSTVRNSYLIGIMCPCPSQQLVFAYRKFYLHSIISCSQNLSFLNLTEQIPSILIKDVQFHSVYLCMESICMKHIIIIFELYQQSTFRQPFVKA